MTNINEEWIWEDVGQLQMFHQTEPTLDRGQTQTHKKSSKLKHTIHRGRRKETNTKGERKLRREPESPGG